MAADFGTGHFWAAWAPAIVAGAMATTAGLIVLLHPLLHRYASARPNARSSHTVPTPQGGGIAVLTATIAATLAALLVTGPAAAAAAWLAPVFGAAVLLGGVGALDDIRNLGAVPRLVLQVVAVAVVVTALPADLRLFPALPVGVERALLLLGGVWFVNLVNFMDGIDWMTVAEIVPVTAGLVVIGLLGALQPAEIMVALALGGSLLGFAPFNRPVARLFLGDVGSLPIGLLVGWLLALVAGRGHLAAALLLPLYYLADATLTILRRLVRRERIWEAHRTHFYQRATERGWTVPQVVARVLAVNLFLVGLAVATVVMPLRGTNLAALAAGGLAVAWLLACFSRGRK
jgi:UDP-N-acetylmuramyl pentapeptide phosphotransferase/UDP-N-acetylglucosamine-1-phosphate transferase